MLFFWFYVSVFMDVCFSRVAAEDGALCGAALTSAQLARVLGVGREVVRGWSRMGCPCYSINDRPTTAPHARLRFVLEDVIRWRQSMTFCLR